MLAVAASQLGIAEEGESAAAAAGAARGDLGLGVLSGLAFGIGGAALINLASRRSWLVGGGRRIATLAIAIGA
jgi:hypothetical protein